MCFWLIDLQSFHEPPILLRCQLSCFCYAARPLKQSGFQALIQQNEPIVFPVQRLDPISPSATEQEQRIREWVQLKLRLHQRCKPVDALAQIRIAASDKDSLGPTEIVQHVRNAVMSICIVSASIPG